jgi:predicted RNA-binding protein YlqC (UPF0109 family)
MKGLVLFLIEGLIDAPDAARVREVGGERGQVVEVSVAPGDRGRLIGKEGRTIRAIRSLVSAAASRDGRRVMVEVLD